MPDHQRATVAAYAGVIAFTLTYVLVDYASLPHLYYLQLERRFVVERRLGGLPAGYLGLWLAAATAGAAAAALTHAALRWRKTPAGDRAMALGLAWSITSTLLAAGYFAWQNF